MKVASCMRVSLLWPLLYLHYPHPFFYTSSSLPLALVPLLIALCPPLASIICWRRAYKPTSLQDHCFFIISDKSAVNVCPLCCWLSIDQCSCYFQLEKFQQENVRMQQKSCLPGRLFYSGWTAEKFKELDEVMTLTCVHLYATTVGKRLQRSFFGVTRTLVWVVIKFLGAILL